MSIKIKNYIFELILNDTFYFIQDSIRIDSI